MQSWLRQGRSRLPWSPTAPPPRRPSRQRLQHVSSANNANLAIGVGNPILYTNLAKLAEICWQELAIQYYKFGQISRNMLAGVANPIPQFWPN